MSMSSDLTAADGTAGPSSHQGVIHDLGYRHYDGPRLGRAHITRALFVDSARGAYGLGRPARNKITPMLLLGAICLPARHHRGHRRGDQGRHAARRLHVVAIRNVQLLVMIYGSVARPGASCLVRPVVPGACPCTSPGHWSGPDYVAAKFASLTSSRCSC